MSLSNYVPIGVVTLVSNKSDVLIYAYWWNGYTFTIDWKNTASVAISGVAFTVCCKYIKSYLEP